MYEVPSNADVAQVVITAAAVTEGAAPTLVTRSELAKREKSA